MTSSPVPSPAPLPWSHCAEGADPTDPLGCRGVHVTGNTRCLAHLTPAERAAYLTSLTPGDPVDHRGTTFDAGLLGELLGALCSPATATPHIGDARFTGAEFTGHARFDNAMFLDAARFDGATFSADARFDTTTFVGDVRFDGARFTGDAWFDRAKFSDESRFDTAQFHAVARFVGARFTHARYENTSFRADARFSNAKFSASARFNGARFATDAWFESATFFGDARFDGASFSGDAQFDGAGFVVDARFTDATFSRGARFDSVTFSGDARFGEATFVRAGRMGPMRCRGCLDLSGAVFSSPVEIEAAARRVACVRTRWESTATVRVRYAEVDLTHAVLTQPIAIVAHTVAFLYAHGTPQAETGFTRDTAVRIVSIRGVDAAHLVLTDTDLTACVFSGAFHLDQLGLEGDTVFGAPPIGWRLRRGIPARLARRRTIAEEHHWRALHPRNPPPPRGWTPGPGHPDPAIAPGPEDVGPVYRALRKASEDGKNEPDAADFYYGEMEMRRHDRKRTTGERALITGYWLLSGYGLRATRALWWLLLAMTATVLATMLWGLPTTDPKPHTTGIQAQPGQRVDLVTGTPDAVLAGGMHDRLTAERAEKATRVVVNSVVFRSSGQNLTTPGTYIEMASRLLEPILLALALLAIRGRVKR
ncbi:pentapeptide repeat-containing protein [Embleya sp. NPDC050493]|uniref:pentapeptide repeat-containing protein n=1 Tax=Embleya sp. NPDC050493 TaxID=3363989 RepID=UPI0037BB6500